MSSVELLPFPSKENFAAAQGLLVVMCRQHNQQGRTLPNGQVLDSRDLFDDTEENPDTDCVVPDEEMEDHEQENPPSIEAKAALERAVTQCVQTRLLYLFENWQHTRLSSDATGLRFHDLIVASTLGSTFPFNTFPNPIWVCSVVNRMVVDIFDANRAYFESVRSPGDTFRQEEKKE